MTTCELPKTIQAVQLTGPDSLILNKEKPLPEPGKHQLICRVEVVGLCFSDLKLLKQFEGHVRKSAIVSGIDLEALKEIPSYAPDKQPTVPGHEVICTVVKAGSETMHEVGKRFLVQADTRFLKTAQSNAAFGYNYEGGLQEYVLIDERMMVSPEGESMLLPVSEERGCSAISLVEPWACVEDAYIWPERQTAKAGGRMLIVADAGREIKGVKETFSPEGAPAEITVVGGSFEGANEVASVDALGDAKFDDIIYFGSTKEVLEKLDPMADKNALINIVQNGGKFGAPVSIGVGRIHYGGIRFCGTTGDSAADGLKSIPATPELRDGDKNLIVGAAGPMGVMNVIRNICQGIKDLEVVATDFSDDRLASLDKKAAPEAEKCGVSYRSFNPGNNPEEYTPTYTVLMVPIPALVAQSVIDSAPNGIINIFAGIQATVWHEVDMDQYVEKGLYFVGTSGSNLEDMRIVLGKVESGRLDTNLSVAAVSGMAGAIPGIRATEDRSIAGKIVVYPMLKDMGLITLEALETEYPTVFAKLNNGQWCKAAEDELLAVAAK